MFASFYAFTVSRSATDCEVGCAASILTPASICAAIPANGDEAAMQAAYDSRCFGCTARGEVQWPCAGTVGKAECRENSGLLLRAEACAQLAGDRGAFLTTLRDDTGIEAAQGACVLFLADQVPYDPFNGTQPSFADKAAGPGVQVIVGDSAAAGTAASPECADGVVGSPADLGRGLMCYSTPLRFTLRALLVPGLWGFMATFLAQAMCSIGSGLGLICFKK